ncbi:cytochrome c oxidase subunit 6C-like [Heteronotia binoei]|uniref:cytochrome c oxidase subunit 6C-like n=1 Tax=Heteronotia binoei TaxID=13085 RepID=UPI00292FAA8C|nr:cytochrome c oxidase subunit 6C-like [Heteronotia binoei]
MEMKTQDAEKGCLGEQPLLCEGELSTLSPALLPKRQMRGLFDSHLKKHHIAVSLLSLEIIPGFKFGVSEPRKQAYAEFYKNHDAAKEFEAMREAGIFQSAPPKKS